MTSLESNNSQNNYPVAKPFLKWAGGKGQLLSKFEELYPEELINGKIKNYFEPFIGSGAVFFHIAQKYKIDHAHLYDINEELILTYHVVQKDVDQLIETLEHHESKYIKFDKIKKEKYYYKERDTFNSEKKKISYDKYSALWIRRAAQLIFLNKTCYNGLYRVNSKGEFNSPAGDYKNPTICDEENLRAVSKLLKIAIIKRADFKEVLKDLKPDSFIYLDPPYKPISKTANFNSYSMQIFSDREQLELAELYKQLDKKKARLMLSNSDPKNHNPNDNFFDEIYEGYNIERVAAKRMINSKASGRGMIKEIVVMNYERNNGTTGN